MGKKRRTSSVKGSRIEKLMEHDYRKGRLSTKGELDVFKMEKANKKYWTMTKDQLLTTLKRKKIYR